MRIIQSASPRPLNVLAVGPGGLVAAASTTSARGGAEAWDVATGTSRWAVAADRWGFHALNVVCGGTHLLAADLQGESLFRLRPRGEPAEESRTGWRAPVAAADDRAFVASGGPDPALTCWGVPRLNLLWKRDREDRWPERVVFGPIAAGGRQFALGARYGSTHPKQFVAVRDGDSGAPRAAISLDPADPVRRLAFTADGAKLIAVVDSRMVTLFDARTGAPAGELVHPGRSYVTAVAVHPAGPVACARTDGTVTFWDPDARRKLRTFDWKAGKLLSVAFAPDGAVCAAGTEDGRVVVWDVDL